MGPEGGSSLSADPSPDTHHAISTTATSHVALFLFAREKLLFRYPLKNPFEIEVTTPPEASHPKRTLSTGGGGHSCSSNAAGRRSSTAGAGIPYSQQQQQSSSVSARPASPESNCPVPGAAMRVAAAAGRGGDDASSEVGHPTPTGGGVGIGSRYKKKKKQQQDAGAPAATATASAGAALSRQLTQRLTSTLQLDGTRSGNTPGAQAEAPPTGMTPSVSMLAVDAAGTSGRPQPQQQQSRSGTHSTSGGPRGGPDAVPTASPAPTCVGIPTNALLHLLRASFTACTTISVATCTLMVFPLIPMAATPTPAGPADTTASGEDHPTMTGPAHSPHRHRRRSRLATVTLVVAMRRPDTDTGSVSRFVQVFMNALLREEHRAQYVSKQVDLIERLTAKRDGGYGAPHSSGAGLAMDDGGGGGEASLISNSAASASTGVDAKPDRKPPPQQPSQRTEMDVFAFLARDTRISLCSEVVQLAHSIDLWTVLMRPEGDGSAEPAVGAVLPRTRVRGGVGRDGGEERLTMPEGLYINRLVYLPLSYLTGTANRTNHLSSVYARLNPCGVVRLLDPSFPETLQREYVDTIGRRYAKLLALSTVYTCLMSLTPPWRVGAFYRCLERVLLGAYQQRLSTVAAATGQATKTNQRSGGSGGSTPQAATNTSLSPLMGSPVTLLAGHGEGTTARETATNHLFVGGGEAVTPPSSSAAAHHHAAGLDFLAIEVIEFLRLREAIDVETEIAVSFTHGDIMPSGAMENSLERAMRRRVKQQQRRQSGGGRPSGLSSIPGDPAAVGGGSSSKSSSSAQAFETAPSTLILVLLQRLQHGGGWPRHEASTAGGGMQGPGNTTGIPSPSTWNSTSNFPSPMSTSVSEAADRTTATTHVCSGGGPRSRAFSHSRNTSATASAPSISPLIGGSHVTAGMTGQWKSSDGTAHPSRHQHVSAHRPTSPTTHEVLRLRVYCAWGAACPICEELASAPSQWVLPVQRGCQDVPIALEFPFLDPSVQACARHAAHYWGAGPCDKASAVESAAASPPHALRPWFLKPEMYMTAVGTHGVSALQVYRQRTLESKGGGTTAAVPVDDDGAATGVRQPATTARHLSHRSDRYIQSEEEDGGNLLHAEAIPSAAVAWLTRCGSTIGDRLQLASRWRGAVGALSLEPQTEQGGDTPPIPPGVPPTVEESRTSTTRSPGEGDSLPTANRAAALASPGTPAPLNHHHAAAVALPRSMKYSKRQLSVSSPQYHLTAPSLLAASHACSMEGIGPVHVVGQSTPLTIVGAMADGTGRGPLVQAERVVPVEVLVQFCIHHLVACLWGVESIEMEVLLRRLERNLRRLRPFLANITYILQLRAAGLSSKSFGLQHHTTPPQMNHNELVQSADEIGTTTHSTALACSETSHHGGVPDTIPQHCSTAVTASEPTGESDRTGTAYLRGELSRMDAQLLHTYELYEVLGLLPVLLPYRGYPVEPIETRLLLHTAVNELSDVFLMESVGPADGSRTVTYTAL